MNRSKPVTFVSVKLHTGKLVKLELNENHTVKHLFNYCRQAAPATKGHTFKLMSGKPPKPLTDMNATLESAQLLKSLVTQKLV